MIKVSLYYTIPGVDVCKVLEDTVTDHLDIEDWLEKHIPSLDFDCMDVPYDSESFYDSYFRSTQEDEDAKRVFWFLEQKLVSVQGIEFSVHIVNERMQEVREICQ